MKKYLIILSFGIASIATDSYAMMQKIRTVLKLKRSQQSFNNSSILITKQSKAKIESIGQDYQAISNLITNKSLKLWTKDLYKKPSDLINNLLQDKSIHTKRMSPAMVFFQHDIDFLDQQFEKIATQHGPDHAWNNMLFLMQTKLENERDKLRDREFMHSAALVSLKQEKRLPKLFNLFDKFGEYDDVISFNIEHWSQKEKDKIIENITHHKNILSKE